MESITDKFIQESKGSKKSSPEESKGSKKRNSEEFKKKMEEMKNDRKFKGLLCNTRESFGAVDLLIQADISIKTLRDRMYLEIDGKYADALFGVYKDVLLVLEKSIQTIAKVTKKQYKQPQFMALLNKNHVLSEEAVSLMKKIEAAIPEKNMEKENSDKSVVETEEAV